MAKRAILLLEDDADTRESLRWLLEEDGYHVRGAETMEQALTCAAQTRFDVVCCDLHVQRGHSGLEVAGALHTELPQARFIALTGDVSGFLESSEGAPAFAAVFQKPVDYAALLAAIEAFV